MRRFMPASVMHWSKRVTAAGLCGNIRRLFNSTPGTPTTSRIATASCCRPIAELPVLSELLLQALHRPTNVLGLGGVLGGRQFVEVVLVRIQRFLLLLHP